ncbi:HFX_2341 family transcriptional regulator domain-containing protein [Methanoplanus limicola]|nr:DUF6293 family protein [Methanoplanus limicola]
MTYVNNVGTMTSNKYVGERIHIIPLGHEYDRAIAPFTNLKAERAYVLSVPVNSELNPDMLKKQNHFTKKVITELERAGIKAIDQRVNLFDINETLKAISILIVNEKKKGNDVLVNMSACGRKTSFAAVMAAMVHKVGVYYVSANNYVADNNGDQYYEHGLSIVEDFNRPIELLSPFKIMLPKYESQIILKELYEQNEKKLSLLEIIKKLGSDKNSVEGFENCPSIIKDTKITDRMGYRSLLNKVNRNFLSELLENNYIERKKSGREYYIKLTESGETIACVSGLLEVTSSSPNRIK